MRALYNRSLLTFLAVTSFLSLSGSGCTDEVPAMHRGRRFLDRDLPNRGTKGQEVDTHILGPGKYSSNQFVDLYLVDCRPKTIVEPLSFTTKDQKVLWLDVYVRVGANCSDTALKRIMGPETIFETTSEIGPNELYAKLVRQAVAQAVEERLAGYTSYELNAKAGEFLTGVQIRTRELLIENKMFYRYTPSGTTNELVNVEVEDIANRDSPASSPGRAAPKERQRVLADGAAAALESVQAELREEQTLLETANARKARLQAENETAELERKLAETESATRAATVNGILSILWGNLALLLTVFLVIGAIIVGARALPPVAKTYMEIKADNERMKRVARTEEAAADLITLLKLDRELAKKFHEQLGPAIESEPPNAA